MFSIIVGILASVFPNLLFVWLYNKAKASAPDRFVKLFYLNEGIKFGVLALLVSACLQWPGLQVVKFFSAFLLAEFARLSLQFFFLSRKAIK